MMDITQAQIDDWDARIQRSLVQTGKLSPIKVRLLRNVLRAGTYLRDLLTNQGWPDGPQTDDFITQWCTAQAGAMPWLLSLQPLIDKAEQAATAAQGA